MDEELEDEEEEEEEEEYPDNIEPESLEGEYEEEDVYVVVELPPGFDSQALSTSAVSVKVRCPSISLLHFFVDVRLLMLYEYAMRLQPMCHMLASPIRYVRTLSTRELEHAPRRVSHFEPYM